MYDSYAYTHNLPCRNPNCKSYGHVHPNCECYSDSHGSLAYGGSVDSYCSSGQPHSRGCQYYAEGGTVAPMVAQQDVSDNPEGIVGYSAVHHGLLGLLKDVGHSGKSIADPFKHAAFLDDMKTPGNKIHDSIQAGDYEGASEGIHDHVLSGSIGKKNLNPIMQRMAQPIMAKDPNPEGFKSAVDYLHSSIKGHNQIHESFKEMLGPSKSKIKPDKAARKSLADHLDSLRENPEMALEVGGSLGHYLPAHAAHLAAHAAAATQYFGNLKPKTQQLAPLDSKERVDKQEQATYDRQLDIAQNPLLITQHIKDGTLIPQDVATVSTIYPGVYKKMVAQGAEALIDAKTHNTLIPYKQKQSLSLLLDQPLDFTQTPAAAQAIMKSQIPIQAPVSKHSNKTSSGASAATQRTIEKTDRLYQTPSEARQIKHRA